MLGSFDNDAREWLDKAVREWLDKKRDEVNRMIVEAHPAAQPIFHKDLKIINRLAELERIHKGEMTAQEYLRTLNEMCAAYAPAECNGCPFDSEIGEDEPNCLLGKYERYVPSTAIERVKRWREEQDGH